MGNTYDLRSALEILAPHKNQLIETDREVDARAEISGIYCKVGARGTVKRPTRLGPAMIFNNIKGYPDARVAIGVLGSRKRIGLMLGLEPQNLGRAFLQAVQNPVKPVIVEQKDALCQEIVYSAKDPDFDLRKIVPVPLNTEKDAGPFITMGLCHAHDLDTNESNLAIHRFCIQGPDEMTMGFGGTRHIGTFFKNAKKQGKSLPVSISIGADPAIYIASCFQSPLTPMGFDELSAAGALRGQPVELVKCKTIDEYAIANAEYVIEGELDPEKMVMEDQHTHTGWALPEFSGYNGPARYQSVLKVKAVTCRKHPIMQVCIGASEEHVNMAGIAEEAGIMEMTSRALPGIVKNVYCPPCGGGKLTAILQCSKEDEMSEGKQQQAALVAFGSCIELKNVFLVDEDIDIYDADDVMWAMTTRFKPELDLSMISNTRCHKGDPTEQKTYDPAIRADGLGTKTIYDCTVPYELKKFMERPVFMDVDVSEYLDE